MSTQTAYAIDPDCSPGIARRAVSNFTKLYLRLGIAPRIPVPAIQPETNAAPYVMTGRPLPVADPMAWLRSKPGYWVGKSALDRGDYEARPAEIQERDKLACRFLVERGKLI